MHHCYIGLPQHRFPPCHNALAACFFGAICGADPITSLTRQSRGTATSCACGSLRFAPAAPHFYVRHQLLWKFHMSSHKKLMVLTAAVFSLSSFYVFGQVSEKEVNATTEKLNKVSDCAELYKGNNTDLFTGTKCAIAKGNSAGMENAVKIICQSHFREIGCPSQLLQLAYFYSDKTNPARNLEKSKSAIQNIFSEYPNWNGISSAKALLSEIEKSQ